MTEPTNPDERLRAALQAEAEGVEAGDDILERIHAAADSPAGWKRRAHWLAAAAALVVVVGTAVASRHDPADSVISNDPDPTSTTTPPVRPDPGDAYMALECRLIGPQGDVSVYFQPGISSNEVFTVQDQIQIDGRATGGTYHGPAEVLAEFRAWFADSPELLATVTADILPTRFEVDLRDPSQAEAFAVDVVRLTNVYDAVVTDCTTTPDPGRPSLVALVREDGMLVAIDLTTGEERELYAEGDPNGPGATEEGGSNYIDSVEMSPSGEWIYFSTCCEPAGGNTYRIATTGGEPELVAVGSYPRLSPDGRYVATGSTSVLIVTPVDPVRSGLVFSYALQGWYVASLAWSPDGTQLAYVADGEVTGEVRQVDLLSFDGAALTPADMGKPDNPGAFVSWMPDGTPVISSGGPIDDERSLPLDRAYRWLLWVDEEGIVREQPGHESSERNPLLGLPKALAADW